MELTGGTEDGADATTPLEVRETVRAAAGKHSPPDPAVWITHGERLVDDTRRLRLSVAQVELPDGVRKEHIPGLLTGRATPTAAAGQAISSGEEADQ